MPHALAAACTGTVKQEEERRVRLLRCTLVRCPVTTLRSVRALVVIDGCISKRGAVAIEAGMVLSNEPGYYRTDHYGIRLENLVVACHASDPGFLCFETLTLCPFDRRLLRQN